MEITSLSLFLLGFAVLPPCLTALFLLLRALSSSITSIYRFPARAHLTWLPDSPFLHGYEGCAAAAGTPDSVALLCMEELRVVTYQQPALPPGEQQQPQPQPRPAVECAFCLSAVEGGQEVRELRCAHLFHRECLDRWLCHRQRTCPLCRNTITVMTSLVALSFYGASQLKFHWVERYDKVLVGSVLCLVGILTYVFHDHEGDGGHSLDDHHLHRKLVTL
ncbi:hypothetical protein Taro_032969 [Colocasia esculenta]|uniref:RING-type domain-containing protein n=1 Tax=Colocasia esculenta TaxID=4460 RepID=A0A843VMM3_COLES|nr:hypothetical protein [Colocasia esculenta]